MEAELKLLMEEASEKYWDDFCITNGRHHVRTIFKSGAEFMFSHMSKAAKEKDEKIKNLTAIIAKEISENDEFGSEFVIASILRSRIAELEAALQFYSDKNNYVGNFEDHPAKLKPEVFIDLGDIARAALKVRSE